MAPCTGAGKSGPGTVFALFALDRALSGVNIIRSYAGLRCKPVDGLPIIGGDEEKLQNFGYFLMHSAYSYTAGISPLAAAYFMGQVDAEDPLLAQLHYRRFLYGGN